MQDFEKVARSHDLTVTYKLHVLDKKTKKEYYIERSMTEPEVVEYISKKAFENCTVIGYPNIRTASGDNIKVFK
mgnify:CR=1 FL=1